MQSRILVVEDDHIQRSILQAALTAQGFEVETAEDGMSAVWQIRDGRYDIVLLDYDLPEIDGVATAGIVSDLMGNVARPRLIALTATPQHVLGRELVSGRSFDGIVEKSGNLQDLIDTINANLYAASSPVDRRAAECDLLIKEWGEYETVPSRELDTPARLLLVEDDDLQRFILRDALAAQGYDVATAPDGLSAVRMMKQGGYDLAVIDYELPEIDGFATARLITDMISESARPRLVALTAEPDGLRDRAAQCHRVFDEVLGKSDGPLALLAAVARQLRCAPGLLRQGPHARG